MSSPALILVLCGGLLYTGGIFFLLWERLPHHNTIWHVFVLTATAILYAAVIVELWGRALTA
jgi:hemolysin III